MKDLALDEITIRKYEMPSGNERDIIRKFCLSIGLLQEGDRRDIITDVLLVLLKMKKIGKLVDSKEINKAVIEIRKSSGLNVKGVSESNIRRQLKRLRDLMIVEKIKNNYRITEFESMQNIFERIVNIKLKNILDRIKQYAKAIDEMNIK